MTSCLVASLDRLGGISSTASRVCGGVTASAAREGGIEADFGRLGGIDAQAERRCGMTARFFLECRTSIRIPYLEIDPDLIWVLAGTSVDNDVISNTYWNVH